MMFLESLTEKQKLKAQICIFESSIVMQTGSEKKGRKTFLVSEQQLASMFGARAVFKPQPGLEYISHTAEHIDVIVKFPKRNDVREISVKVGNKITCHKVVLPSFVGIARFRITEQMQEELVGLNLYAYSGQLTPQSNLYELPLPNISGGSVCLGSVRAVSWGEDYRQTIERAMFGSYFNNHYDNVGKQGIRFGQFMHITNGKISCKDLRFLTQAGNLDSLAPLW
jgi:hypothetical protein